MRCAAELVAVEAQEMGDAQRTGTAGSCVEDTAHPIDQAGPAVAVTIERWCVVAGPIGEPTPTVSAEDTVLIAANSIGDVVKYIVGPHGGDEDVASVDGEDLGAFPKSAGPDRLPLGPGALGGDPIEGPGPQVDSS